VEEIFSAQSLIQLHQQTGLGSRKMRIYVIIQQSMTAIFALGIIVIMVLTLETYNGTKNVAGAWPNNPLLTPTIVCLAMACLTFFADVATVLVYCCNVKVAASLTRWVTKIRALVGFLQGVATAGASGYFKISNNTSGGKDLWGWACSSAADAKQGAIAANSVCQNNVRHLLSAGLLLMLMMICAECCFWFEPCAGITSCAFGPHGSMGTLQTKWGDTGPCRRGHSIVTEQYCRREQVLGQSAQRASGDEDVSKLIEDNEYRLKSFES
jgi:hypothetical protein